MKSPLYLLLAAALTLPVAALAAGPSAHDHGTGEPQKVELSAGKKWQIDAPLRQGMGAMRKAVNHMLPLAHAGKAHAGPIAIWLAGVALYHLLPKVAPALGSALPTLALSFALAWATRPRSA